MLTLGGIKGVDSSIPCGLHDVLDDVSLLSSADGEPSSVAEGRDLETGVAEPLWKSEEGAV
jgi:hypothetical protein